MQTRPHTKTLLRTVSVLFVVTVVALAACNQPGGPRPAATPDVMYAERWWNTLTPEQMVAALYGTRATEAQETAAKKLYDALDPETKKKVNDAAYAIGGAAEHESVGAWWETLNCKLMRIAAGDGNEADPMSTFCAHYPGSGEAKILGAEELAHVNKVGMALLGRSDPGDYPPYVLNPPAWIHGTWGYCGVPDSPTSWQFLDHRIVLTSEGGSFDSAVLENVPQARLSEEHGATWYRFDYEVPTAAGGTFAAWHRFDMTDDALRVAWTSDLPGFAEAIPFCRSESQ